MLFQERCLFYFFLKKKTLLTSSLESLSLAVTVTHTLAVYLFVDLRQESLVVNWYQPAHYFHLELSTPYRIQFEWFPFSLSFINIQRLIVPSCTMNDFVV